MTLRGGARSLSLDGLDMPAGQSDGAGTCHTAATRSAALRVASAQNRTSAERFGLCSGLQLCGLGPDSYWGASEEGTER